HRIVPGKLRPALRNLQKTLVRNLFMEILHPIEFIRGDRSTPRMKKITPTHSPPNHQSSSGHPKEDPRRHGIRTEGSPQKDTFQSPLPSFPGRPYSPS